MHQRSHAARSAANGIVPVIGALITVCLGACGGGGGQGGFAAPPTFTIGGMVSGLAGGAQVVLRDNGGDSLTVTANGAFTFVTPIANGSAYSVTVAAEPVGQTCAVAGGSAASVTATSLPLLWTGAVVGGAGLGGAFTGTIRSLVPLVEAHERAGLFSAIYLVSYITFGVPVIVAGLFLSTIGVTAIAVIFGAVTVAAAAAGVVTQLATARRTGLASKG